MGLDTSEELSKVNPWGEIKFFELLTQESQYLSSKPSESASIEYSENRENTSCRFPSRLPLSCARTHVSNLPIRA